MEKIYFFAHIAGIILSILSILKADKDGFAWFRGKTNTLNKDTLTKIHRRVWIGLVIAIISGILLFWDRRFYLLNESTTFVGKMIFVVALTINGFFIGRFMDIATQKPFKEITLRQKIPLFISGAISTISWIGAITLAFFL